MCIRDRYINDLVNTFNEAAKISEQMMGSSQANTQMIELMKSMDASFIINMIPMVLVVVIIMRAFLSYTVGTVSYTHLIKFTSIQFCSDIK